MRARSSLSSEPMFALASMLPAHAWVLSVLQPFYVETASFENDCCAVHSW